MRGKNYLPLLLILAVIIFWRLTKSTYVGTKCKNPENPTDCNGSYETNAISYCIGDDPDADNPCVVQACDSGYGIISGTYGVPKCVELGSVCTKSISNGALVYELESDLIHAGCVTKCYSGYEITQDSNGNDVCTWAPVGACIGKDPNGVYTYGSSQKCRLESCKFGYMPSDDKCVPVPPGYYSSSRQI